MVLSGVVCMLYYTTQPKRAYQFNKEELQPNTKGCEDWRKRWFWFFLFYALFYYVELAGVVCFCFAVQNKLYTFFCFLCVFCFFLFCFFLFFLCFFVFFGVFWYFFWFLFYRFWTGVFDVFWCFFDTFFNFGLIYSFFWL